MEFCDRVGIPHSEFLSWEETDQEAEIQYLLHKGERCPGCGTFPDDWLEGGRHKVPPPFITKSVACVGCEMIAEAREEIPEHLRNSVYVYLTPNEAAYRGRRFGQQRS